MALKVLCWNMRRAKGNSLAWNVVRDAQADILLLQEVGSVPADVLAEYAGVIEPVLKKTGAANRFHTALFVRGTIEEPVQFTTNWEWVNAEIRRCHANLLSRHALIGGKRYRLMSVYSPAWPLDLSHIAEEDIRCIRLSRSRHKVWVTELLWAALANATDGPPWIVGGDLNNAETFSPGALEVLERLRNLDLVECLRTDGLPVPTFRNPKGGHIRHQLDYMYVTRSLSEKLTSCMRYRAEEVWEQSYSDHAPVLAMFHR